MVDNGLIEDQVKVMASRLREAEPYLEQQVELAKEDLKWARGFIRSLGRWLGRINKEVEVGSIEEKAGSPSARDSGSLKKEVSQPNQAPAGHPDRAQGAVGAAGVTDPAQG